MTSNYSTWSVNWSGAIKIGNFMFIPTSENVGFWQYELSRGNLLVMRNEAIDSRQVSNHSIYAKL